jgi:hypothetical protein
MGGAIKALIGIILVAQVATSLAPSINSSVAAITTPTYSVGVSSIFSLYPLLFALGGLVLFLRMVEF